MKKKLTKLKVFLAQTNETQNLLTIWEWERYQNTTILTFN